VIEKRFVAISEIHNATVRHAQRLLGRLKDVRYQAALAEYRKLRSIKKPTADEKRHIQEASQFMNAYRDSIGLTDYGFKGYALAWRNKANLDKLIASQQAQKERSRVWQSVAEYLFRDGEAIHFKQRDKFHSISGETNDNGAKFNRDTFVVTWMELTMRCKLPNNPKDLDYITESIVDHHVCYCDIERLMFPNGWHYYVKLTLRGYPPNKHRPVGDGVMGIDPGVSTMACVSDDAVALMELAPDAKRYNQKIQAVQRKMDRSKRATNPDNYNPDGTVKKGTRGKWHYSKTYLKNKRRLQTLNRQKSAYIKQSHEIQCNKLLESAKHFYVEQMSYKGLQRKAKKTERSSVPTEIPQKDGSTKSVYKYKRRKRFGRSMNNRSPSKFIAILKLKVAPLGGSVTPITTKDFKASQYNHITDTYEKIPLKQRFKTIGNTTVQRDLYSAFLIRNTNSDLDHPDRERCIAQFDYFVTMQNELISTMQSQGISMKQCFGF
jgi:hypothetical protein